MAEEILLTFVHITDTHIHEDPHYQSSYAKTNHSPLIGTRAIVEQINALPFTPDFVLHTGDVAFDPVPEAYHAAREELSKIKYPVHYLVGNHDESAAMQRTLLGNSQVSPFLYYEFAVNGVQIICLDSNGKYADDQPPAHGYLPPEQLAWLDALCSAHDERPLVVAVHHNPLRVGGVWLDDYMGLENGDALHDILLKAKNRLRGVFFGHVHQNLDIYRDGILYTSVLSTWYQLHAYPGQAKTIYDPGAEPGFSVVTVSARQTFIRRYRYALPK